MTLITFLKWVHLIDSPYVTKEAPESWRTFTYEDQFGELQCINIIILGQLLSYTYFIHKKVTIKQHI